MPLAELQYRELNDVKIDIYACLSSKKFHFSAKRIGRNCGVHGERQRDVQPGLHACERGMNKIHEIHGGLGCSLRCKKYSNQYTCKNPD